METVLSILALTFIIVVHELGHYIASKIFGLKVKEFAVGFGPVMFKLFKHKGTQFNFRPIILGGFISFENDKDMEDLHPFKRMIISLSGPMVNVLIGYIGFIIGVYLMSSHSIIESIIGVSYFILQIINGIGPNIYSFFANQTGGGVIEMVSQSNVAISSGAKQYMAYFFLANIGLGITNLLPVPALDGFSALRSFFEWVTGIKTNKTVLTVVTSVGVVILVVTMVFATYLDISRIIA